MTKLEEKFLKVAVTKKYGDYLFCEKTDCKIKTCCKHFCHNSNVYLFSATNWHKDKRCYLNMEVKEND